MKQKLPWMLCASFCLLAFIALPCSGAFGSSSDKVLLQDVSVLTLKNNRMTAGRRSSPVPQLSCVGGSAKGQFIPSVVQCYNRGSDGNDIQWECKADMDNDFRFGEIQVTCEGYDYPDDPYILKGSCGLEYTLELTKEGRSRNQGGGYSHQHGDSNNYFGSNYGSWKKKGSSAFGNLLFLAGMCLVIYLIYKTCLAPNVDRNQRWQNRQPNNDSPPPYETQPPPYGFRSEYMPNNDNGGCSSSNYAGTQGSANTGTTPNTGGNFWTGAATGGLLGYLFGRNTGYGGYTQHQQPWGSNYRRPYFSSGGLFSGSGFGSSGFSSGFTTGGGGSSKSSSSGTRTASGFGGTSRR